MNEAEQILYDRTGMLGENHPSIIEAMDAYAKKQNGSKLEHIENLENRIVDLKDQLGDAKSFIKDLQGELNSM